MYGNLLVQLLVGSPPDYSKFDNAFKCKSDLNSLFFPLFDHKSLFWLSSNYFMGN